MGIDAATVSVSDFTLRWLMQIADLGAIGRYADDNSRLTAESRTGRRVVFLGDSITENWVGLGSLAPLGEAYVNRGIGGQGAVQMLLRIQEDVVGLEPDAMVLLAGTNDLRAFVGDALGAGAAAEIRLRRNLTSLADIARANGIRVSLGSITPICDAPPELGGVEQTRFRSTAHILGLNRWIAEHAESRGYVFLDFHAALADWQGRLDVRFTTDGLHLNAEGYARMAEVLTAARP